MEGNKPFVTESEKSWGLVTHLAAFATFVVPFGGAIIAPLIIWLLKKDSIPFVDDQGKEVLNFNLSIILYYLVLAVIAGALSFILIGFLLFPLFPVVFVFWFIFTIIGAIKAHEGQYFRYPLTIRFIR